MLESGCELNPLLFTQIAGPMGGMKVVTIPAHPGNVLAQRARPHRTPRDKPLKQQCACKIWAKVDFIWQTMKKIERQLWGFKLKKRLMNDYNLFMKEITHQFHVSGGAKLTPSVSGGWAKRFIPIWFPEFWDYTAPD